MGVRITVAGSNQLTKCDINLSFSIICTHYKTYTDFQLINRNSYLLLWV